MMNYPHFHIRNENKNINKHAKHRKKITNTKEEMKIEN